MARQKKQSRGKEPKGYRRKKLLGLVPHVYDKHSKSFQEGAWKNLELHEAERNRQRLRGVSA